MPCGQQRAATRTILLTGPIAAMQAWRDPRVRGYYRSSFDSGFNDTKLELTLAQFNRAILGFERKIPTTD